MNEWTQGLTLAQRIKRRINLTLGLTYTHPDERIEMEWDEVAGIKPSDDEFEYDRKFRSWMRKRDLKRIKSGRIGAALMLSIPAYLSTEDNSLAIAMFVAGGVYMILSNIGDMIDFLFK
jgi:hypothetical protein